MPSRLLPPSPSLQAPPAIRNCEDYTGPGSLRTKQCWYCSRNMTRFLKRRLSFPKSNLGSDGCNAFFCRMFWNVVGASALPSLNTSSFSNEVLSPQLTRPWQSLLGINSVMNSQGTLDTSSWIERVTASQQASGTVLQKMPPHPARNPCWPAEAHRANLLVLQGQPNLMWHRLQSSS